MGRPLYSAAYTTPAVRVEPEPIYPTYHRWSERQFDPDSEEFFESEDVVYEAFISPEEQAPLVTASMPVLDSTDDEDSGSSGPPSRDEHASSHAMEPPTLSVDAITVISRDTEGSRTTSPTFVRPPFVDHLSHRAALPTVVYQGDRPRTPPLQPARQAGLSTPSPAPTSSTPHASWATPRSLYGSPSPAPTTTPRVYTWVRSGANSGSPSPRDGPFMNGGARRSLPHISAQPTVIRRIADPVV